MKAVWTGTISFGLVEIPIKVTSAIQEHVFGFHILHAKCHTRLEYQRWCPKCEQVVGWEDTVKGYEQSKGKYRIFTKEELEQFKPESTQRIDILAFISHGSIQDIFQDNHYYVLPGKAHNKSYFLLHDALAQSGLIGIGRFVMREKEYLCSIEPYEKGLLLNTLHYAYEIRSLANVQELKSAPKISKSEMDLGLMLIKQMTRKKLDITQFKDTYAEQLMKELQRKKKPQKITEKTRIKTRTKKDLESLLRSSLEKPSASTLSRHSIYAKADRLRRDKTKTPRRSAKKTGKKASRGK